jgi:hypothetical protein
LAACITPAAPNMRDHLCCLRGIGTNRAKVKFSAPLRAPGRHVRRNGVVEIDHNDGA